MELCSGLGVVKTSVYFYDWGLRKCSLEGRRNEARLKVAIAKAPVVTYVSQDAKGGEHLVIFVFW